MPAYEVVVDVMLKPEILDPAGQAVVNALPALGLAPVSGLRIGKHVEITVDADDEDAALAEGTRMAEVLLANPVIEDFSVRLGDEVLTPDSSRFWPADGWSPGRQQPSFDKQYVRDWLDASGWDRTAPGPELPVDVVERTREKYVEAYERLTGSAFDSWLREG